MAQTRPKCLIIHFSDDVQQPDYEEFLRSMWGNLFLDLSIIDVQTQQTKEGNEQENFDDISTLHYFNPFTDDYVKQEFEPTKGVFPNKLLNLWGYSLNVGFIHSPPHSFIKRNCTGNLIEKNGVDIMITKLLSEMMNFLISDSPAVEHKFGHFSCKKDEATGELYQLLQNQLQIISTRVISTKTACKEEVNDYLGFEIVSFVAVVPIFREEAVYIWIGQNFLITTGIVVLFLVMIDLFSKIWKFDPQYWGTTKLIEVILGLSVPELPREMKERIIFGSVVIVSFVYSSNIYAAVTDFHFHSEVELELNTLKELNESSLNLIVSPNLLTIVSSFEDGEIYNMMKKSQQRIDQSGDCIEALAKAKNHTCFMRKGQAEYYLEQYNEQEDRPIMKILEEPLFASVEGFMMEPGSPYTKHFRHLIHKMSQSGLISKWEKNVFLTQDGKRNKALQVIEEMNPVIKIHLLIGVLVFGYSASILAFFGEVIVAKLKK